MDVLIDAVSYQQSQSAQPPSTASHQTPNANASTPQFRQVQTSHPSSQFQPRSTQAGSPHRCHLCARTYERADHLNRHLKSHENARPHKCSRCPKSFNRADLLNRHEASHDKHATGDSRPRIERGERVAAACRACVSSKSKCQEQKPCPRCVKKGLVCEDGAARESKALVRRESLMREDIGQAPSLTGSMSGSQRGYDSPASRYGDNLSSDIRELPPSLNPQQSYGAVAQHNTPPTVSGYYRNFAAAANSFDAVTSQDLGYLTGDSQFSLEFGFTPRDAYFSQNLDPAFWDIDMSSIELAYPFNDSNAMLTTQSPQNDPHSSQKSASKRSAAFERSPWLFNPTQKDHRMNDHENLNVDEDSINVSAASPPATMEDFSFCCINAKIRDELLGIICTVPNRPRKIPSLPSLALLNNVIQVYFVQESFRVDRLIHAASFDPQKALPHLVLAILARGATNIATPAIWKMGLALQGVIHHSVGELFETNNSNTRNLQAVQSFVISLDIALWSGFNRKMEIAEAFGPAVAVMLRRSGAFAAPRISLTFVPEHTDSESVLESKWKKWADMESWKRLVLHYFMHDIHASIGLQKPPQLSFTELRFALPAARELWTAKSAKDWRNRYLSTLSTSSLPTTSLLDAMHTPDLLNLHAAGTDVQLSALGILHGFWGQIWSLLESKKFYPLSKATHRLSIFTSHTELYRDLVAYANLLPSLTHNSAEATLIAETLLMILHVLPEDLQRFAGKHGESEARTAGAEFAEWSGTNEARIAVWHAGQAFRAANRLDNATCKGFNAIALYYASLTLWVFGLMISTSQPLSSSNSRYTKERIVLNEPETSNTKSWRLSDDGTPGVSVFSQDGTSDLFCPLEDTNQILQIARDVYKNNFPAEDADSIDNLPPLVENLRHLLRDLGDLPGSRVSTANSEGTA